MSYLRLTSSEALDTSLYDSIQHLVVHPKQSGRSQSQGPLVTRESTLEILSMVYKGTITPWDQGLRAVYKRILFPLVVLASFIGRTLY